MLNHIQVSILRFLSAHNNGSASFRALSEKFGPSVNFNLSSLIMSGYVSCARSPQFHPSEVFFITSKGYQALGDARFRSEKTRQHNARKEREKEEDRAYAADQNRKSRHHDYLVAAFEALLTFILGIIAEYKLNIAALIVEFLEEVLAFLH